MNHNLNNLIDLESTIVAISTPSGVGGIAVARLSGPEALSIANRIWEGVSLLNVSTHSAHLGTVKDSQGKPLDEAVATVFKGPKSFTGQDTVEFSVHGSRYVQNEIITSLVKAGARVATAGEFTRRAFLSGKMQLSEAEAVADILVADSRAAHRIAMSQMKGSFDSNIRVLRERLVNLVALMELELDFSEEDVTFADRTQLRENASKIKKQIEHLLASFSTGNAIANGIPVAIIGLTNAGKSSLLNALVDEDRAIVSDIHGTTRDTIEATTHLGDYLFRFIDTAGIRQSEDPVEKLGIERSLAAINKAHLILCVIDSSSSSDGLEFSKRIKKELRADQTLIMVLNKSDLQDWDNISEDVKKQLDSHYTLAVSAKKGQGINALKQSMAEIMDIETAKAAQNDVIITNQRHAQTLRDALHATEAMINSMDAGIPADLVAQDARAVIDILSELTGDITTDQILGTIFSRFCIGK